MQIVLFIGIQATGKSSFYKAHFFNSHVRISLDLLNTRNKERQFLETCFATESRFVVDNTNPTIKDRARYIEAARKLKYEVVGYYFSSSLEQSLARNETREGKERIPDVGIKSCFSKLQLPSFSEGFDQLHFVKLVEGTFVVEGWKDEV